MDFNLEDFFPYYVSTDPNNNTSQIVYSHDHSFAESILLKKEFNTLALPRVEPKPEPGSALLHQQFMARFMSPNTPYDRMLVYHGVGTGKCVHPSTSVMSSLGEISILDLWNHCSKNNQVIYTEDVGNGEWIDVSENIIVPSYSTIENKIVGSKVNRLYREKVDCQLRIITLENGYKIISTFKHRFYHLVKAWTNVLKPNDQVLCVEDNGSKNFTLRYKAIRSIEYVGYMGYVYDLDVGITHSYIANYFVSHNTCLMSTVGEYAAEAQPDLIRAGRQAVILVSNPTLKKNVINEIATKCTVGKYTVPPTDPKTGETLSQDTIRSKIANKVKKTYYIATFTEMANEVASLSDTALQNQYNGRLIMIDEAHNLRVTKASSGEIAEQRRVPVYKMIYRLLHVCTGLKIMLLSATPMRDKPSEIVYLMNLLLPEKEKISPQQFRKKFFDKTKLINEKDLKSIFYGRVSYLRSMTSSVQIVFAGDVADGFKRMKTYELEMSKLQSKGYNEAYHSEVAEEQSEPDEMDDLFGEEEEADDAAGLYIKTRQSSSFVFPDGSYGKEGEDKYLKLDFGETETIQSFRVSEELEEWITANGRTQSEMLKQLKKLSVKFWFVIKTILENPGKKMFVYSSIVNGGGAILFGAILQLFDFDNVSREEAVAGELSGPKKRFCVLTNATISSTGINNLINQVFNAKSNLNGEFVQVIIGSHIIGEGISFFHIRKMFLLTPRWNNATTEQVIGRAIRAFSHDDLPESQRQIEVYRLAAIPSQTLGESETVSIDLKMYAVSETKDIKIKGVEKVMKEVAVDCQLNYNRNALPSDEDKYTCDAQNPKGVDSLQDTYNLYFATKEIDTIISLIKDAFRKRQTYLFQELYELLLPQIKSGISGIVLARALHQIISNNIKITNHLGFENYLREDRDLYFLTDDPISSNEYTSAYYAAHPIPQKSFESVEQAFTTFEYDQLDLVSKTIERHPNKILQIIQNIGTNLAVMIVETVVSNKIRGKSTPSIELVYDKYKEFFIRKTGPGGAKYWINTFITNETHYALESDLDNWTTEPPFDVIEEEEKTEPRRGDEEEKKEDKTVDNIKRLQNNPYRIYAVINTAAKTDKERFRIKDAKVKRVTLTGKVDKRKERSEGEQGTVCGTGINYQLSGLVPTIVDLIYKAAKFGTAPPLSYTTKLTDEDLADSAKVIEKIKRNKNWEYMQQQIIREIYTRRLLSEVDSRIDLRDLLSRTKTAIQNKKEKELVSSLLREGVEVTEDNIAELTLTDLEDSLPEMKEGFVFIVKDVLKEDFPPSDALLRGYVDAELKGMSKQDLTAMYEASYRSAPELCKELERWFMQNNLYMKTSLMK